MTIPLSLRCPVLLQTTFGVRFAMLQFLGFVIGKEKIPFRDFCEDTDEK
jgi:hypothetical protein